ncbi:hypothetical protein XM38_018680 [Halomicronema hongdechloris C2206]|uniref:Uncharacterized protein n=1 Tax=Halomicronema hongdechloris C2206 TaxID=1641165 RepID=A0A1Z3HKU5_9CYAN|nr:hypothetical protein [Halomicronema hongdechloris]ASC70920.1 hypothetical protein XM38_018680 [Halomicronema hongdechloris C2206]
MAMFADLARRLSWLFIVFLGIGMITLSGDSRVMAAPESSSASAQQVSDSDGATSETMAELRQKAFATSQAGDFAAADAYWSQLIDYLPQEAALWNNRGNAQAGLGRWSAAWADYRHAVALDPEFALARVNQALASYQLGHPNDAIAELRALVRRYPNFADARAALTAALWAGGQWGEAESHWVAAVGLDERYGDLDWVRTVRRWPPAMVEALEAFLSLGSVTSEDIT